MKQIFRKILLVVCACVFVYSAYQLTSIYYEYNQVEKESANLIEEFVEQTTDNEAQNAQEDTTINPVRRIVKFDGLLKKNSDVIGWIYIPDTNIDEPLLKGETNETYLRTNINKKRSAAGSIFIDERNAGDLLDPNTIIYGHNMKNGSRFHNLRYFVKSDYYKEHPYIYIYLPNGTVNVYEVYASDLINAYSDHYSTDVDYASYVSAVQKTANQKTTVSDTKSPLIMLSTCYDSDSDKRYVVYARLKENVRVNEL